LFAATSLEFRIPNLEFFSLNHFSLSRVNPIGTDPRAWISPTANGEGIMEIVYSIMMGVSLAACAGFRAWLPLFVMGMLARFGSSHVALHPSLLFLQSDTMLIIFGIASVVEFLGDKFIAVDHFLDAVGTVARPIAGTLLMTSVFTHMDLPTALVLGLIVGGGTALTMHAGKAVVRAKSTLLAPFHGGTANAALSFGEDIVSLGGSFLAVFFPVIAFVFAILMLGVAGLMIFMGIKAGHKLFRAISNRPKAGDRGQETGVRKLESEVSGQESAMEGFGV
jgi:hypothetical protein